MQFSVNRNFILNLYIYKYKQAIELKVQKRYLGFILCGESFSKHNGNKMSIEWYTFPVDFKDSTEMCDD